MDRREMYDLNRLIDEEEAERRAFRERRKTDELRDDWARISKWSSMYVGYDDDIDLQVDADEESEDEA